jgi:putative RecB family exonuclease
LEHLFGLPANQRTIDQARALLQAAFVELEETAPADAEHLRAEAVTPEQVLDPAEPLLDTYFTLEDPQRLQPKSREMGVSASLTDDFTIRGFVDRVDEAADGAVRIVDYKTGRAPAASFESKAMFQMRFYALIWWRMSGDIPAMLQLLYLGSGHVLRYQPDAADLLATERKILAIRQAISRAAEHREFQPAPSKLCDWCSFRDLCPAFGGTPPQLPDSWINALSPGHIPARPRGRDPS